MAPDSAECKRLCGLTLDGVREAKGVAFTDEAFPSTVGPLSPNLMG